MKFSAAIALASSFVVPALALSKPVLFSDGLSPHVDQSFYDNLVYPNGATYAQWSPGSLPLTCKNNANSNGVSPSNVEVYTVKFTDCGNAWVFCRANNANLSIVTTIELFGRLPVHERQWVRHVMAVPGGGSAYMSNADVVFQGPVGTPSVFQHETGHAVDFYKNSARSSSTSQWLNAINADSCVPDAYSNSNEIEDFTQVGVLVLYDIVTPGGLNSIGANWSCLANQKSALESLQKSDMTLGGSCVRRWADDTIVSPTSSRFIRDLPKVESGLPVPGESKSPVTVFKNLVIRPDADRKNAELIPKISMEAMERLLAESQ
ncbi:hypothetical protein BKA62DRAFT_688974 [Auriculariales sp. MPI-PUGE-AT-0066]|nr:hypothetical protein BKA62DRAFT_688974 [Auriculariales sp. MPI-PUGE-AT-0066]